MNDLISRQETIDALERKKDKNAKGDIAGFYNKIIQNDIDTLMQLPPAQPEIIRCKDCKYWMPYSQLGFDEDNGTYHNYCEKLIPVDEYYAFDRDADDYCSMAERRTDEPEQTV